MEKAKAHITLEIIQYTPNAVVSKTIIRKIIGNITASFFDAGGELAEKTSLYNYIQIIDGEAELTIKNRKFRLHKGESIIMPAHSANIFNANKQFKMISTMIKSGYEV